MSTHNFETEGAANALVDEARFLADQVRQDAARSREVTQSLKLANQALEAAIFEIDVGRPTTTMHRGYRGRSEKLVLHKLQLECACIAIVVPAPAHGRALGPSRPLCRA
jgi:hypothetical protein